jgi:MYXO-CTERM domain-containing protein
MNPPAADMGTTKMSSGGCSCDVSGRDANLPLLSLFAFALLAFALRRRARR